MPAPSRKILEDLLTTMRKSIGGGITEFVNKTSQEDIPTDKWILHSIIIAAYTLARQVNYPFANLLAAHLSMSATRAEAHLLVDAAFDKAEQNKAEREKKLDKLLS